MLNIWSGGVMTGITRASKESEEPVAGGAEAVPEDMMS